MTASPARIVIVVWSATPEHPELAAAPFVYALAARALDAEVEMHFTGPAVRWLVPGVAETAFTDRARTRTVADYLRDTRAAGVQHYGCTMALAEHCAGEAWPAEVAGAASVVAATLDPRVRTLVF